MAKRLRKKVEVDLFGTIFNGIATAFLMFTLGTLYGMSGLILGLATSSACIALIFAVIAIVWTRDATEVWYEEEKQ